LGFEFRNFWVIMKTAVKMMEIREKEEMDKKVLGKPYE